LAAAPKQKRELENKVQNLFTNLFPCPKSKPLILSQILRSAFDWAHQEAEARGIASCAKTRSFHGVFAFLLDAFVILVVADKLRVDAAGRCTLGPQSGDVELAPAAKLVLRLIKAEDDRLKAKAASAWRRDGRVRGFKVAPALTTKVMSTNANSVLSRGRTHQGEPGCRRLPGDPPWFGGWCGQQGLIPMSSRLPA
jgi:hypothetical protein